jgi:hypothetical protein
VYLLWVTGGEFFICGDTSLLAIALSVDGPVCQSLQSMI